jgi:hypothetical protein
MRTGGIILFRFYREKEVTMKDRDELKTHGAAMGKALKNENSR